jgi:hypothetical protein
MELFKIETKKKNDEIKSKSLKSTLTLFLVLEAFSMLIGFVTLLPGKSNHIKEFPSMDVIIHRECICIAIPVIILIISSISKKIYGPAKSDTDK